MALHTSDTMVPPMILALSTSHSLSATDLLVGAAIPATALLIVLGLHLAIPALLFALAGAARLSGCGAEHSAGGPFEAVRHDTRRLGERQGKRVIVAETIEKRQLCFAQ